MGVDVSPQQRIEDMIRVTELCIDLLKENEEHHGEVGDFIQLSKIRNYQQQKTFQKFVTFSELLFYRLVSFSKSFFFILSN